MDKIILCGTLVTGDGKTLVNNKAVWIRGGKFCDITDFSAVSPDVQAEIVHAEDKLVVPGAINHHTHGCTLGPLFPSATTPVSEEKAIANLWRHLSQGTTTVCNVDGMGTPEETLRINRQVPIKLYTSTANTPKNVEAAEIVDGKGLRAEHRALTTDEMLRCGAVAVGEMGGGHTLGGGGQDYLYIPNAFEKRTGIRISTAQARELKFAALGRYMSGDESERDMDRVAALLESSGLSDKISAEEAVQLIKDCVLPSIATSLAGFEEGCRTAIMNSVPFILHNSAPSVKKIEALLLKYGKDIQLVAGHCNHDTFTVDESVYWARRLKELGAIIDVGTFDLTDYSQQQTGGDPEYFDAMIRSGLADIISTDYNGGCWDGLYTGVARIVEKGYMGLAEAVALCTGNLRKVLPLLAKNSGLIEPGFDADFVVADCNNVGNIRAVYIDGQLVYQCKE